ncbi:lysylphosphatidylglycerol synthase transmembrane domain-containing protein [Pengzhenrongella sicca]|uniref:Flippase-like domain-containing protein n=1 Tax=Pengzhenrongella sicca TaxID=2819238 RepID=A0A8A4ZC16_9MICO|nr:lysylphosphatidylglycerol synthase transmembrane domain-containing protein [Pengzhenrongella sicca]QTE29462.1 flippase-like domain-containing protein [Pengzhenrongella sicca]
MPESIAPVFRAPQRARAGEDAPSVQIEDTPTARVHHPSDLVGLVLTVLSAAVVMLLAVYAHGTTAGVAADVQGFSSIVRRILVFPVAVLEASIALIAPIAVLTELAVRRLGRQMLEVVAAGVAALVLCAGVLAAVAAFGSDDLVRGLSVWRGGQWTLSIPASLAALAGLLTTAGPRGRRRSVDWSWNLVWVSLGVVLVTGQVSLPGAALALLIGRAGGLTVRYVSGVQSERAYGPALVAGIRRAGFTPARLVRVPEAGSDVDGVGGADGPDESSVAIAADTNNRVYELTTDDGEELSVVVLDGDRQVIGGLSRLWRSLRLRGIEGRSFVSLRQAAERAALLAYAARAAGVRTPALLAVAEAEDSMLLIQARPGHAVALRHLDPADLDDELLRAIWAQLRLAHDAGIAHRALTSDTVLVEPGPLEAGGPGAEPREPLVWLTDWDSGDIASSELARRMDLTQMLALLALRVGATRALESATAVLPDDDIAALGPMLQTIALPHRTREEIRAHREVLADVRSALVERLPEADVEPERLVRFGARTVITVILPVVAVVVVLATINVEQIASALSTSDWRWSVVAFALGLLTFFGAALAFVAFSPVRLAVWNATLVQTAGAFVALAAPAGIGPAALNLRMLTKRGVTTSLAVATVALVQVSQFVVTIALLLVLSIGSGTNEASRFTPSPVTLLIIGVLAGLAASSLLVPAVRQWLVRRTMPTISQTWPRLIEVVGQPRKLALALAGNVLMTMGYVLAFDASLAAFGQELSLVQVALVYLIGNAAGAAVPSPGGIGTIELALIGGLTAAGLNPGVATSVAILFRVLTYWLRIPIGWVAMRTLQRSGEL